MKINHNQLLKSRILNEPIDKVWQRWTTHDGLKTFFGLDNFIELFPGGAFEIYFLMDNPIGQRGSEGCKVLSYLPNKMFSFSWNAPPQYSEVRNSEYKTWVVVEFNSVSANQTKVSLTHLGWLDDEKWDVVFDYFNEAWDTVLDKLNTF